MDLVARRELNNGFGNTLARSFEMAVTPVIFAGGGFLLDRVFGTSVLFTILLLLFAIAGVSIKWYYDYTQRLDHLEAERAENRRGAQLRAPVLGARDTEPGALATGVTLDGPREASRREPAADDIDTVAGDRAQAGATE